MLRGSVGAWERGSAAWEERYGTSPRNEGVRSSAADVVADDKMRVGAQQVSSTLHGQGSVIGLGSGERALRRLFLQFFCRTRPVLAHTPCF